MKKRVYFSVSCLIPPKMRGGFPGLERYHFTELIEGKDKNEICRKAIGISTERAKNYQNPKITISL